VPSQFWDHRSLKPGLEKPLGFDQRLTQKLGGIEVKRHAQSWRGSGLDQTF
jgi:hypothetical protein